jgi:hypothetical protein
MMRFPSLALVLAIGASLQRRCLPSKQNRRRDAGATKHRALMLSALGDSCRSHGPIPLLPRSLDDRRHILRITGSEARKIIHGRPYRDKDDSMVNCTRIPVISLVI